MAYNSTGLVVHDADAHIMEPPTWLRDHADPGVRDRLPTLRYPGGNELRQSQELHESTGGLDAAFERLTARHPAPDRGGVFERRAASRSRKGIR